MRTGIEWIDIESLVEMCNGCALRAKGIPIKFMLWQETNHLWSHLNVDFAGPLNGSYYLITEDRLSKWPKILWCKKPTLGVVIGLLNELLVRFVLPDSLYFRNCHANYIFKKSRDFVKCSWRSTQQLSLTILEATANQNGSYMPSRALWKFNGGSTEASLQVSPSISAKTKY